MISLTNIKEQVIKKINTTDLEKVNIMINKGIDKNNPDYYIEFIYNSKELSMSLEEFLEDIMYHDNDEDEKNVNELKNVITKMCNNPRFFFYVNSLSAKTRKNFSFNASHQILKQIFGDIDTNNKSGKDFTINKVNAFSFTLTNQTQKFNIYFIYLNTEKEDADCCMICSK